MNPFSSSIHYQKSWVSTDDQCILYPKDEGQCVMISAIQSREVGFGVDLSEAQIKKINQE
jgi:hypothetical protein